MPGPAAVGSGRASEIYHGKRGTRTSLSRSGSGGPCPGWNRWNRRRTWRTASMPAGYASMPSTGGKMTRTVPGATVRPWAAVHCGCDQAARRETRQGDAMRPVRKKGHPRGRHVPLRRPAKAARVPGQEKARKSSGRNGWAPYTDRRHRGDVAGQG
jgi:hypothetical protein